MAEKMTREAVIEAFGVDPETVGNRHRCWWILKELEAEDQYTGAEIGDLCVKTRDGASNPIDTSAFQKGRYVGSSEDGFDPTYRYYYYRATEKAQPAQEEQS